MVFVKILKNYISIVKFIITPKKPGLYKYKNYEDYRQTQIKGNLDKIENCWVNEDNIKFLSKYIKKYVPDVKLGICHGTRRGEEQKWFHKYLGIKVIGTEISPSAKNFPNTIQWDFHDVKDEWIDNIDFIYSNSFDHSFKPKECLDAWMSCINKKGVCILEWTNGHVSYNKRDPFGETLEGYKKLISKKYKIKTIIKAPSNRFWKLTKIYFIVVAHMNKDT